MADDKISQAPIKPLPVTVIGVRTSDSGAPITDGQIVVTPDHQPNLLIQVINPLEAIAIRFINAYLKSLLGLLTAAGFTSGSAVGAADFYHAVARCAVIAVAGPVYGLIKDFITVFGDLEKKHPLLTGSV